MNGVGLSVIAPMFNERENVPGTIEQIEAALKHYPEPWELIIVDDGSSDGSADEVERCAAGKPHIRLISYRPNRGRGYAIRQGFAAARGRFVVTVDFDLSYEPGHILRMEQMLRQQPETDIVLASAYAPGGKVENVPFGRLVLSKIGNLLLRYAFPKPIYTSTCIVRAYRREALERLELCEDGKEIHLEILRKAFALGMRIEEIPATLRGKSGRRAPRGQGRLVLSHLAFLLSERPGALLATAGAILLGISLLLCTSRCMDTKGSWERIHCRSGWLPIFALLGAAACFGAWFLALQIKKARNGLYLMQSRRARRRTEQGERRDKIED